MSAKRPVVDLMALTAQEAVPMSEAVQRSAPQPDITVPVKVPGKRGHPGKREKVSTANLEGLAFKVPPSFRKRFRSRAAEADLKLNELLFAAFEAWEIQQGFKKS